VDKEGQYVPFALNPIQRKYLLEDSTGRDIVLKARQQGFSSLILARFTADFILEPNSQSVVVADIEENAEALLERVKGYIRSWEEKNGFKIPLKYNSKSVLVNEAMNSKYTVGTAKATEFGRSRTITNLHLSEAAFYPDLGKILAGAGNAVTPSGYVVLETTANGFNEFKGFWDRSEAGESGYAPLFYPASALYGPEFLEQKRKEQGRLFRQEYPESPTEAFLTSGETYFSQEALERYLKHSQQYQASVTAPIYA
jgi:hypothetical protein